LCYENKNPEKKNQNSISDKKISTKKIVQKKIQKNISEKGPKIYFYMYPILSEEIEIGCSYMV